jgi:hypothetical protein
MTFTTGAAAVPKLAAGSGDNAGTLFVSGSGSGNTLAIDLNQHTASEGSAGRRLHQRRHQQIQ